MSKVPKRMLEAMREEISVECEVYRPRHNPAARHYSGTTMEVLRRMEEDDFGTPPEVIRLKNMEPSTEQGGTWTRCCPICKALMIKRHPPVEEVTCSGCGKYIWR
jgi:hypothetical protein